MNTFKAILTLTLAVAFVKAAKAVWAGNTHPKADPHPSSQIYYATTPKPYLKVEPLHHQLGATYTYHDAPRSIYHAPLQRPDYHSDPFQGLKSEPAHYPPPPPQVRHKHSTVGGSDGQGSYHVLLPDGQTQTVNYHVDDAQSLVGTGFDASPLRSFRAVR